jgi:hypothetical protein
MKVMDSELFLEIALSRDRKNTFFFSKDLFAQIDVVILGIFESLGIQRFKRVVLQEYNDKL